MSDPKSLQLGCVLVVEDDPVVRRIYGRMLDEAGFSVSAVSEGAAVAAALSTGGFDAVLTDLGMPGMNGGDVLRLVRERDPDLPVILMTGSHLDDAVAATEGRALRYLLKPVRFDALCASVAEAVRLRRARTGT
jgi:DNA-binding NtrC family response regulator